MTKKQIGLFLGPILFILVRFFYAAEGLSDEANAVLASTLWIAAWWITEAVPIAATALLPIVLFPLTGGLALSETTASYGHKYIFLFIGGFMLAIAIERWNLHKRIALTIIKLVGTNINKIILGFMLATAFLSMWISNTATAVMILPVGIAIILQLQDNPTTKKNENLIFGKALMLSIAYSASIGGMATLIGTPPNLVLAGVVESTFNTEITFFQWFLFGFPLSMILLFICWMYLTKFAFKFEQKEFPGGKEEINRQLASLGSMSYEEKIIAFVFSLTAIAWICRSFLLSLWIPAIDDTIIAITGALLLFLIPNKDKSQALLTWEDAVKLPWGILILFGGGMALATAFESSGLAIWIGSQLASLEGISLFILLLVIIATVNFLTEITSNLATTAMLLPILVSVAAILNINPYYLLVSATVAASCAFMLPVATPPNAVVFGSGYLSIKDMVQKGIWMNLISIIILTLFVYFALPWLWGLG
ncbi:MAG: sodium-dependent dicarboxylate transporter 2/3/5 [Rubritalea sp.]|jgi:sodium-dependent dicarboxylate transporter 2/3/5